MRVTLENHRCIVERESGDKRLRKGGWGSAESQFWHWVKLELQKQGFDVIKRRMQSDGHLYGDEKLPYIRHRKNAFYVYDGEWAVRDIVESFSKGETIILLVQRN